MNIDADRAAHAPDRRVLFGERSWCMPERKRHSRRATRLRTSAKIARHFTIQEGGRLISICALLEGGDRAERLFDRLLGIRLLDRKIEVAVVGHMLTGTENQTRQTSKLQRLEFRKRPRKGHPLVIEAATFIDPEVHLIGRSDGRLDGFADFMKSTNGKQYQDGGSSRPSDFLAIRRLVVHNGMLELMPPSHEQPMRFEQLEINLTASPDADRPGWYAFKANVE